MTTATPLPPTLTATSEPTMTPTPQPTQTSTPEPSLTATNTEEPTLIPTSAPTELPTQQSIEIMMNREGVTGKLYEARYYTSEESQNLIYNAPLFDGEDIYSYYKPTMRPAPKGYGLLFINFTTNTSDMLAYIKAVKVQVLADVAGIELPKPQCFASEAKNPKGFIGCAIPILEGMHVKGVNVVDKATGVKTTIYDAVENPPIESK